ncbi:hypothetical protein LZ32DRAFT_546092, partial [Colletotrichum eremochloae]
HNRIGKQPSSTCVACNNTSQGRVALGAVSGNGRRRKQTRSRCQQCDVALCNSRVCWYRYHQQNL